MSSDFETVVTAHYQFNFWLDYETIRFKSEVIKLRKQCITKNASNKIPSQ